MRPLTTVDVAHRPAPGMATPTNLAFSPGGTLLTYLIAEPGSLRQRLRIVDVASGDSHDVPTPGEEIDEASLTLDEQLRRERARDLGTGVTRYAWAPSADRLLIPMSDGLWVLDDPHGQARRVVAADDVPEPPLDARISADGTMLLFVSAGEVWTAEVTSGARRSVTEDAGRPGVSRGLAEYIAQEEMGRPYGCWLSTANGRVAFCEVDEAHIPAHRIVHQGAAPIGGASAHIPWEEHRYPFAGAANATVRLGVVPADGSGASEPLWLDLGSTGIGDDRYLARVSWQDEDHLLVQVQSRDQRRLDLIRFHADSGASELLLSETSGIWVNLHDLLRTRSDGSFVWASERSGFRHLELRGPDGALIRPLTAGEWMVTDIVGADDDSVWFTSTEVSPVERHLYRVDVASGEREQLSRGAGTHQPVAHAGTGVWAGLWSDLSTPATLHLHGPGTVMGVLEDAGDDPTLSEVELFSPVHRTVTAADGSTELHAHLWIPDGDGPHPLIVYVYGGPHAQLVVDAWRATANMRPQFLRQQGYLVAAVDNRGSFNRGLHFEAALHRRLGTVEVDDQVRLVEDLVGDGLADPDRVGIYGWSYGGYMSALCLARRPDVYRAAAAGAPCSAWENYDTHYTERYMDTPAQNPDGYAQASVLTHAEGIRGRALLLIHGLIDENVHFAHTARLVDTLVRADIDHRLVVYPGERHAPRGEADRSSMESQVIAFFDDALRR